MKVFPVFCVGGLGPGRCGTNILPGDRRGGDGEDGREVSVASDDDETEILVFYFAGRKGKVEGAGPRSNGTITSGGRGSWRYRPLAPPGRVGGGKK